MALPTPDVFCKMDDAAGSGAADETTGARTLTKNGTIGSTTGIITNARTMAEDLGSYFSRASDSVLQTGNVDFTIFGWVKPSSSRSGHIAFASKAGAGGYEYLLLITSGGTPFFFVFNTDGSLSNVAILGSTIPNDSWSLVIGWLDSAANKVWVQANDGTPASADRTVTLTAGTAPFRVGAYELSSYPLYGAVDEVGWYKGKLDAAQRTSLYNSGAGRTWSQAAGWGDTSGAAPRSKVVSQALSNSVNW